MSDFLFPKASDKPTGYRVEHEVMVAAGRDRVWEALVGEVGAWWPQRYREDSVGVWIEAWPGGRWWEQFDAAGNGALYATITFVEPPALLRFAGPMGMPGAQVTAGRYELAVRSDGTMVRLQIWTMGAIPRELRSGHEGATMALLDRFKDYVEATARSA